MAFIRLRDLSVEFPIYQGSHRSLKKLLLPASLQGNLARDRMDRINVRALSDISVDFRDGDRVALIGYNEAGKTTLLKALAGIYIPTRGQIYAQGKVSSLFAVNVGGQSGGDRRTNIILHGMYMDVHPRVMRTRIDEVAAFTELGAYLYMPVRTYSAGMSVRPAFTASTCIPPDILLMDEWISAGDARFLEKAQASTRPLPRTNACRASSRLFHSRPKSSRKLVIAGSMRARSQLASMTCRSFTIAGESSAPSSSPSSRGT